MFIRDKRKIDESYFSDFHFTFLGRRYSVLEVSGGTEGS